MRSLLLSLLLSVLPAVVFPDTLLPPTCGSPTLMRRIAGGTDAAEGAWPWQVSVSYNGIPGCGGSLISDQWVLSAAHCFTKSLSLDLYRVRLGAHKLDVPNSHEVEVGVSNVFIHLQYNGISDTSSSGDVALVRLSRPVTFTRSIRPVCIPSASMDFPPGTSCYVTGWGQTQSDRRLPFPRTLQQVLLPLISRESCYRMYHPNIVIHSDHICAGYPDGQRDACPGDSGGPLVCKVNGYWYQVGIVSFGSVCAFPNRPSIYASIPAYEPWISHYLRQKVRSSSPSLEVSVLLLVVSLILHNTSDRSARRRNILMDGEHRQGRELLQNLCDRCHTVTTPLLCALRTCYLIVCKFSEKMKLRNHPTLQLQGPVQPHSSMKDLRKFRYFRSESEENRQIRHLESSPQQHRGEHDESCALPSAVRSQSPSQYSVQLGAHRLDAPNSNTVEVGVNNLILHPQFSAPGGSGDIALIRLSRSVSYTRYVRPVCLPSASMVFPAGASCYVTGWGRTQSDEFLPYPKTLQQLMLPLIGRDSCDQMYHIGSGTSANVAIVKNDQICAGYQAGRRDACTGDSGGPLVCKVNGYWYQVGIVSWGEDCALPNRPGVYTYVPAYESWIHYYIGLSSSSPPSLEVSVLLLVVSLILHS
ncbi:transmembrane protease serine 9-like [Ranitomeya imitator]|uniref:transmembrane protease serine 9-like n=1 Tax=Ranitomeya imitator TaxID=111125 RepID=UPI0037E74426